MANFVKEERGKNFFFAFLGLFFYQAYATKNFGIFRIAIIEKNGHDESSKSKDHITDNVEKTTGFEPKALWLILLVL